MLFYEGQYMFFVMLVIVVMFKVEFKCCFLLGFILFLVKIWMFQNCEVCFNVFCGMYVFVYNYSYYFILVNFVFY